MVTLEIVAREGHPDFLDLPWGVSLRRWRTPRLVDVARGLSRHVVRFIEYDGAVYAVKETEDAIAMAEYSLLRDLASRGLPVVEAIGVVRGRVADGSDPDAPGDERYPVDDTVAGSPLGSALITRHLSYSLPYRYLFQGRTVSDLREQLQDAMAVLLVRLHLEGFFWGDCSLSNTLFRRDAGALSSWLVDAETGRFNTTRLSDGQRQHDLDIAVDNIAGELMDLDAAGRLHNIIEPMDLAENFRNRYERLWNEIVHEEVIRPQDRHRLAARTKRLNELGFDVDEYRLRTTDDGSIRVVPRVVEVGHHRKRLQQLTGLDVDENQARRLLNDLDGHRANLDDFRGHSIPDALAAYEWLTSVYEPTVKSIPPELRHRLADAEAYHQILEHRWYLSEQAGHDVGMDQAVASYLEDVLSHAPQEEAILPSPEDDTTDLARFA
jgi:Domain of unknown function (DUF4032)